jgi:hypothetical protein
MAAADTTEEQFEKLNSILGAVNSGMLSNYKSQQAADLATKQLVKSIMRVSDVSEQEATRLAKEIKAEDEAARKAEQREKAIVEGVKKTLSGLQQFAGGAVSASQSIYNSDSAFTAVIPTLNLLGDTVKNITSALASFTSGIPFFGAFFAGVDKITTVTVDLTVKTMTAMLENAQKMVNDYNNLSKTGMTFGASLEKMQAAAAIGGMSLSTYSKFVTGNIENLSSLGGSLEIAAAKVTKMSSGIAKSNAGLLTLYGGLDGLAGATAEYQSMMAKYGIDINKNDKELTAGAQAYLVNMKELSSMTGKSAAALKKDEEKRQMSAAYQMAMNSMSDVQRANSIRALEVTNEKYGKTAGDFATEFIATNGNVTSKTALQFQAMFPEIAETIRLTLSATGKEKAAFDKEQAEIIESRREINRAEIEAKKDQVKLQAGGVQHAVLEMVNSVAAAVLSTFSSQGTMKQVVADQAENRKLIEAANKAEKTTVSGAILALEDFKIGIDKITASQLPRIGAVVEQLIDIQKTINGLFGTDSALADIGTKFISLLDQLLNKTGGPQVGSPGANPSGAEDGAAVMDAARNNINALDRNTTALNTNNSSLGAWWDRMVQANEQGRPGGAPVSGPLTPAVQPTPAPAAPVAAPAGTTTPQKLRAPVKPGQGTEKLTPETVAAVNAMYDLLGEKYGMQVTAGDDPFHKNKKGSLHTTGRAADIKFRKGQADYDTIQKQVNQMFKDRGIDAKVEVHKDETTKGAKVLELSTPKKSTDEKRSAADEENNSLLARLVEIFEDHLAVAEESRDTLDVLKRQMA